VYEVLHDDVPDGRQHRNRGARRNRGRAIDFELSLDTAPRTVEIPDDLQAALDASPAAAAAWSKLSYTHQKEHVRSVLDAKKAETRTRRIDAAIAKLEG